MAKALGRAHLPLTVKLDCKSAISQYRRGRSYCCDAARPQADIWRAIFGLLDERQAGPEALTLEWVKGHATKADVAKGKIAKRTREHNFTADSYATQGADLAEEQRPAKLLAKNFEKQRCFYKALVRLSDRWPEDAAPDVKPEKPPKPPKGPPRVHAQQPHVLWQLCTGAWECSRCGRSGRTWQQRQKFAGTKCRAWISYEDDRAEAAEAFRGCVEKGLQQRGARKVWVTKKAPPFADNGMFRVKLLAAVDYRRGVTQTFFEPELMVNRAAGALNLRPKDRKSPFPFVQGLAGSEPPAIRRTEDCLFFGEEVMIQCASSSLAISLATELRVMTRVHEAHEADRAAAPERALNADIDDTLGFADVWMPTGYGDVLDADLAPASKKPKYTRDKVRARVREGTEPGLPRWASGATPWAQIAPPDLVGEDSPLEPSRPAKAPRGAGTATPEEEREPEGEEGEQEQEEDNGLCLQCGLEDAVDEDDEGAETEAGPPEEEVSPLVVQATGEEGQTPKEAVEEAAAIPVPDSDSEDELLLDRHYDDRAHWGTGGFSWLEAAEGHEPEECWAEEARVQRARDNAGEEAFENRWADLAPAAPTGAASSASSGLTEEQRLRSRQDGGTGSPPPPVVEVLSDSEEPRGGAQGGN